MHLRKSEWDPACALGRFIKNEFWNFDNSTHFLSYKYQDKEMVQKKLCPNIAPSIGTGIPPLHPQSTLSESISMRLHKSLVQTCCLLWQHWMGEGVADGNWLGRGVGSGCGFLGYFFGLKSAIFCGLVPPPHIWPYFFWKYDKIYEENDQRNAMKHFWVENYPPAPHPLRRFPKNHLVLRIQSSLKDTFPWTLQRLKPSTTLICWHLQWIWLA